MRFEWDANKASANLVKHRVSFGEAREVFYDPNGFQGFDALHSATEIRFFVIGLSTRRLLFVVYIEIPPDTVRIISTRRATKAERELYERRIIR
jgi:uncharacterized DUF497 family protein